MRIDKDSDFKHKGGLAKPEGEAEGPSDARTAATLVRYALEHLKESKSAWAAMVGRNVRIRQGDNGGAYWRSPANGYTTNILLAAIYDFEEAWSHTSHCGPEKQISFEIVQGSGVGTVAAPSSQPPPKSASPSDTQQPQTDWTIKCDDYGWSIFEGGRYLGEAKTEPGAKRIMEAHNAALRALPSPWIATSERQPTEKDAKSKLYTKTVLSLTIHGDCREVWYQDVRDDSRYYPYWLPIPPLPKQ